MLERNTNSRKPSLVNFTIFALLLVTSGFTLSACQQSVPGSSSTKQQQQNQSTKVEQQKSGKQQKQNQSTKSSQQKNNKVDDGEDTMVDDDPE